MDANQTRFHLLLGRGDWARCRNLDSGLPIFENPAGQPAFSWDGRRYELTLGLRANLFPSSPANRVPSLSDRRGAAQDRFGNWYWISDTRDELLVNSSGSGVTTHFWASADELVRGCGSADGAFQACAPGTPPSPLLFSGLAVTSEHYLVVGVTAPKGFVVFDLFHGGPPRQFVWPIAIPFEPFDMSPAVGGGVWILDRTNHRLWSLDRTFAVVRAGQPQQSLETAPPNVFFPSTASAAPAKVPHTFPAGFSIDFGSPLGSIDAIGIEALPDGSVLLLDGDTTARFSRIYRWRSGAQLGHAVDTSSVLQYLSTNDQAAFSLQAHDFAFIAAERNALGQRQNMLYVAGTNGDQAWAFAADYSGDQLAIEAQPEYYPMRLFGGKGLVAGSQQVYYDFQDRWIPLVQQKRPCYAPTSMLVTLVFDGKDPDCVWHRLMLDACIPSDCYVKISSRAHNDQEHLEIQGWNSEPIPYRRGDGTEIPWDRYYSNSGLDTWELLFQQATGRYLQLKIELGGNGRSTPHIRALRAYYPRFSYLSHYVPGVYRNDAVSSSFLDRFLSNLEGFFTSIEDRIASVQALLDVVSAPSDALDWLARWFAVALDPSWTEDKRRLFLRHAAQFFEARGTIPGLLMALRLTLEDCASDSVFDTSAQSVSKAGGIRLVEKFRARRVPIGFLTPTASAAGLPVKLQTSQWTPSQGADDLNQRFRDDAKQPTGTIYPTTLPASDPLYGTWWNFSQTTLGFVPQSLGGAAGLWAAFLRGQYGSLSALSTAYRATYTDFANVPYPVVLPALDAPLEDWYRFQGILLIQDSAHQFTIFLPMPAADAQNQLSQRAKLDLARRIADLEKPAHTLYELKFYWAFFRVGDARLGGDTVLDSGSRAPQLLTPAVLGDAFAGSSFLSGSPRGSPRTRPFLSAPRQRPKRVDSPGPCSAPC